MESCFTRALWATPPRILGKQLAPFSLGHAILLHSIGSPYLSRREAGLPDLLTALFLCSLEYAAAVDAVIHKQATIAKDAKRWGKAVTRKDFARADTDLRQYVTDCFDFPEPWIADGESRRNSGVPTCWMIFGRILGQVKDVHAALTMHMPLAMSLFVTSEAERGRNFADGEEHPTVTVKPREAPNG